jgi:poly-gamma-glutamate capsule biosynthesis protein CapA/YwtB (metallophosphatase superfamily)
MKRKLLNILTPLIITQDKSKSFSKLSTISCFMLTVFFIQYPVLYIPISSSLCYGNQNTSNVRRVTLIAVGDIMMHMGNIKGGYCSDTDSYDFSEYFECIKPMLKEADWVIGNLETKLAGKDVLLPVGQGKYVSGYTAYPFFNAPEELAYNLWEAGFTFLSTANNHTMDRGIVGIGKTNAVLTQAGIMQTGTFTSPSDHDSVRVIEKNGIRIAVFAYTADTNGIPIPEGKGYSVNRIVFDQIAQDFQRASDLHVDFITCYLHFGEENKRLPNIYQRMIADSLLSIGADIILGSHSHVVQPYIIYTTTNNRKKVIIYSMGNFLSNQMSLYNSIGMMYKITLETNASSDDSQITTIEPIPIRVYRFCKDERYAYRIIPISDMLTHKNKYFISDAYIHESESLYEEIIASIHKPLP